MWAAHYSESLIHVYPTIRLHIPEYYGLQALIASSKILLEKLIATILPHFVEPQVLLLC
jgi:hypothetical protein